MPGTAMKNAVWRILDAPWLFHAARFLLVGRQGPTKALLRHHLATGPGETVLDVCCGIGEFAEVVDAGYVGIDLNARFIERARERYRGCPTKAFEVGDAARLGYPDGHFDKAIVVNCLHHFSDEDVTRVLAEIRRVTRRLVIVVDADATPRGLLRRALLAMDRGRFMRTPEHLSRVVARVLRIEDRIDFAVGLYAEVLFRCPVSLSEGTTAERSFRSR